MRSCSTLSARGDCSTATTSTSTWPESITSLGVFGGAPVDTASTSFYADASVATAVADRDLTALVDAWAAALPLAGEVIHGVDRFYRFRINRPVRVDCARWSAGRLILLGDAAHAMAPTFG